MRVKQSPIYEFQVGDVVVSKSFNHLRIRVDENLWYVTGSNRMYQDSDVESDLTSGDFVWAGTRRYLIDVAPKPEEIK